MQQVPSAAAAATLTEEHSADPQQDSCARPQRESSFPAQQTPDHQQQQQQQLQHPASACCHHPHCQPQQHSPPEAAEMAACSTDSRAAPPAAGRAGGPVSITPSSTGRSSLYHMNAIGASSVSEQSMGHHMHQLSYELNEQLHVDPKRTRTAPSCCSLCKASQPGESSCSAPSDQTASRLTAGGAPSGAQQAAPEASQSGAAPAGKGTATGGRETPAAAPRRRATGDDCCLNCSCPCHNGSSSSSSIVCFQGPRRPPTFAANLAELCKTFPSVHQGLIVSLLETADNDLQRAYALVRVVSDTNTGLHNSKTGGPMTKRKRCPDDTECLGSLEGPPSCLPAWAPQGPQGNGDSRRGSCGMDVADERPRAVNFSPEQQQQQQQQSNPAGVSPSGAAGGAAVSAELGAPKGPTGAPARFCVPLGSELLPEAWCDEVAERLLWAIVTAASGDDAKAKAAALLKEHAAQLANAHHEAPSQAELAKEAERQELAKRVEMLQNDKLLLARVVKAQHEKLQTLQQNLAAKTEEARHLMQELTGAQQRLRSLRDAAAALVLGASATRNGPCRDNSFDRRFPDVF